MEGRKEGRKKKPRGPEAKQVMYSFSANNNATEWERQAC
jgi:hypothetical protein